MCGTGEPVAPECRGASHVFFYLSLELALVIWVCYEVGSLPGGGKVAVDPKRFNVRVWSGPRWEAKSVLGNRHQEMIHCSYRVGYSW